MPECLDGDLTLPDESHPLIAESNADILGWKVSNDSGGNRPAMGTPCGPALGMTMGRESAMCKGEI